MELNELKNNEGAHKRRMRVGRGIGSGKGKTCGRGYKGQGSRTGVRINGFEGGQMPLHRRLPKRGFKNHARVDFAVLNTGTLQRAVDAKKIKAGAALDVAALVQAGLIRDAKLPVKLLAKGALTAKLTLTLHACSEAAKALVTGAGGSVEVLAADGAAAA